MSNSEVAVFPDSVNIPTWFNPEYLNFQRPEVAKFLGGLTFNPEINNTITTEDRVRKLLLEGGFEHGAQLDIPVIDGIVDPHELGKKVADRLVERDEVLLPGLSDFEYRYTTVNGATDGIEQLMVGLLAEEDRPKIGLIRGDYMGYIGAAYVKGLEMKFADSLEEAREQNDNVVWFVSNPSAINGNLYTPRAWQEFLAANRRVIVDAAYIDLTLEGLSVDVSSPNIIAVITSPSKPLGNVQGKYPGGVCTREEHGGLSFQQKFNNVPRLFTIMEAELQDEFGPHKIASLHRSTQLAICQDMSAAADGVVLPSDATLMAYATGSLDKRFDPYRTVNSHERKRRYTFRLTKEFARRALEAQARQS